MVKSEHIVRYTAKEIAEKLARGEDQTDYAYLDALTDEELEASIDFEDEGEFDWSTAMPGIPQLTPKKQLTVRFDQDIIDWFKAQGNGYQTKMNAVLRSFMIAQQQDHKSPKP
jgi:uncharacterized protein (DUF4415 family)